MNKLNNLEGISKYYCIQCEHFHIRKYRYKINKFDVRIKTKDTPFFNHKNFAYKLTPSEIFKKQFGKSVNNYSIRSHKKMKGSRKQ